MTEIPGAGITTLSMHFPWFCIPTCPSSGMQHGQEPSAVTAEQWWQKGRGRCLRKSLQSTQEQGAQKIGHQPRKAWASHAEHLLWGLESTCVRRGHRSQSTFPGVLFPSHMTFRVGNCKPASSLTLQVSLTGSCASSYRVTWSLNQAAP